MITTQELDKVIQKASSINALVIGDVMLDKYIIGQVDRISPEAPVPILKHQRTEIKGGGAANVAFNLAAWGCHTSVIGIVGKDDNGDQLSDLLEKSGINSYLHRSEYRPTTVKTRVVAASHHLLRIDEESTEYLHPDEEEELISSVTKVMEELQPELIIIEDYNKGLLTLPLIEHILQAGKKTGSFIAVDPKEINFSNYRNADLFKPNHREASQFAHKNLLISDLRPLIEQLQAAAGYSTITITLGGDGVFLQNHEDALHVLPSMSIDVVDVCGAGDAVICALALARLSGLNLQQTGELANLTGAYVCSHSGVVAIDPEALKVMI